MIKDRISASEVGPDAWRVVGALNSTTSVGKITHVTRKGRRVAWGRRREKMAGAGRKERGGRADDTDQFLK
ncbi:MAG: hypothetical protein HPY58_11730 [Firmicutes bacterium]|nr:hypothetical protein [Bacillota bacterium]